jgi:hypothetical protein
MPTANAVQRRGTATSKIGSLYELQLNALRAPTGISHSKIKFAKPASPEKPRKRKIRKHIKSGISTGRLTISTKPNIQRENPNPPGLIILPRKN